MTTALELARKYYPRLWSEDRVLALAAAGKLTQAEADQVLGGGQTAAEDSGEGSVSAG